MKKRLFSFLLACLLSLTPLLAGQPTAAAAQSNPRLSYANTCARALYELGLFRGVGAQADGSPDFALERSATRGESITMLVRLLGKEEEALSGKVSHPFTDTGWADPYVGYAYQTGISNGVSATSFGTASPIELAQFVTLMLRAMGYTQVDWRNPFPLADQVGLDYGTGTGSCLRSDLAIVCYSALSCPVNGTGLTLYETLARAGVLEGQDTSANTGLTPGPTTQKVSAISVNSVEELVEQFTAAMNGRSTPITVYVPAGQEKDYATQLLGYMERYQDIARMEVSYFTNSGAFTAAITYGDGVRVMSYLEGKTSALSARDQQLLDKAQAVCDQILDSTMSQYDCVRAIHDYLVNNTTYRSTSTCYDAYGALVDGYAVCDGYSKAFDLLCYLAGIDCLRITGTASNSLGSNQPHAWNKVCVDGQWYNVDVTWDDPISSRPILRHDYFLISDSRLAQDHSWTKYPHWPDAPANYAP